MVSYPFLFFALVISSPPPSFEGEYCLFGPPISLFCIPPGALLELVSSASPCLQRRLTRAGRAFPFVPGFFFPCSFALLDSPLLPVFLPAPVEFSSMDVNSFFFSTGPPAIVHPCSTQFPPPPNVSSHFFAVSFFFSTPNPFCPYPPPGWDQPGCSGKFLREGSGVVSGYPPPSSLSHFPSLLTPPDENFSDVPPLSPKREPILSLPSKCKP